MATRKLVVELIGDDKSLNRALGRGEKGMSKFGKIAAGATAAIAGGSALAVKAISESVEATQELASATTGLSRITGLSTRESSRWIAAAKVRGVESGQLSMGFTTLAKNMTAATDQGSKQATMFRRLGVSQAEIKKGNVTEILADMSDAFAKMPDGTRKAAMAQQLFGRQAKTLLPIMDQGSQALRDQLALSDKYGVTLDKGQVRAAQKAAQAQRELNLAMLGLKVTVGSAVMPALATAITAVTGFVQQMRTGEGAGGQFRAAMENVAQAIHNIVSAVTPVVVELGRFAVTMLQSRAALGALIGGLTALATVMGINNVVGMVTALGGLRNIALIVGSALIQLRTGLIGVSAAMATTGVGALVVGIGALAGALAFMATGNQRAKVTSDDLTAALNRQADAARAVRDIDLDIAQRKANVASANVQVAQAEQRLTDLRRSGKATSLDIRSAEADLRQARVNQTRANRDLGRAEQDSSRKRRESSDATRDAITTARKRVSTLKDEISKMVLQGKSHDSIKRKVQQLREAQKTLNRAINDLPRKKTTQVDVKVKWPKVIQDLFSGSGGLLDPGGTGGGRPLSTWIDRGVVTGTNKLIQKNIGKLAEMLGGAGGALGRGDPRWAAIEKIAARFGVSSGGPGQRTRPGDTDSLHGTGRARDYSGSTPAMLAFARYMARHFGGKLLELIHTPLGFSIDNMRRTAPFAREDHYDHAHVAFRRGGLVRGAGSGDKVVARLEPGEGVINREAVKGLGGPSTINHINQTMPRFQKGGVVGRSAQKQLHSNVYKGINWAMKTKRGKRFDAWAKRMYGMSGKRLLAKVAAGEGGGTTQNPNISSAGARGPFQFIPSTRASMMRLFGLDPWKTNTEAASAAMIHLMGENGQFGGGLKGYNPGMGSYPGYILGQDVNTDPLKTGKGGGRAKGAKPKAKEKPSRGRSALNLEERLTNVDTAITVAGRTPGKGDDLALLSKKGGLINLRKARLKKRLAKVNRALKGRLTKATRKRLLDERKTLLTDLGVVESDISQHVDDVYAVLRGGTDTADGGGIGTGGDTTETDNRTAELIEQFKAHAEELKGLRMELKRQNDFSVSVANVNSREAVRALSDVISGQIGSTYGPRSRSAGSGTLARY